MSPGGLGIIVFPNLDDGDGHEKYSQSRRPVQSDLRNIFEQRAVTHLDRLLLNHPGSSEDGRDAPSFAIDRDCDVGLPGELDVRAFQLKERLSPTELLDDHAPGPSLERIGVICPI